jgi:hypothetical protein
MSGTGPEEGPPASRRLLEQDKDTLMEFYASAVPE